METCGTLRRALGRVAGMAACGLGIVCAAGWASPPMGAGKGSDGGGIGSAPIVSGDVGRGVLDLWMGPVAGLTSGWHVAPEVSGMPVGSTVAFLLNVPLGVDVSWAGATEVSRSGAGSLARCVFDEEGLVRLRAEALMDGKVHKFGCDFAVMSVQASDVTVELGGVWVDPIGVDESSDNDARVEAYFSTESIAGLHVAGPGEYVTSVGRTVRAFAAVEPAAYGPLMEWRVDGVPTQLGEELAWRANEVGESLIAAGPDGMGQKFSVMRYSVSVAAETDGEMIPEYEPVTFFATTEPPGYEHLVTWLSATKFGTGDPVLGSGAWFTVTFADTFGFDEFGGLWQWLGVRGDNGVRGQDQKAACGTAEVLYQQSLSGRPLGMHFPNGAFRILDVEVGSSGSNADDCVGPPMPGGGTTEVVEYDVEGDNLEEVADAIFNPQNGAGFQEGNQRYAGQCQMNYRFTWRGVSVAENSVVVQITGLTWVNTITIPRWTPPKGTPPAQVAEWNRFINALRQHENGHAAINNRHMKAMAEALVNQAAGRVKVTGISRLPRFGANGQPATAEDGTINDAINAAIRAHIGARPETAAMNTENTNYDAPRSPTNPGGTNHGETQGAVLNTDP